MNGGAGAARPSPPGTKEYHASALGDERMLEVGARTMVCTCRRSDEISRGVRGPVVARHAGGMVEVHKDVYHHAAEQSKGVLMGVLSMRADAHQDGEAGGRRPCEVRAHRWLVGRAALPCTAEEGQPAEEGARQLRG